MLRRISAPLSARHCLAVVAAGTCGPQARWCASHTARVDAPRRNPNRRSAGSVPRSGFTRSGGPLPPAFDVVHWNDEDVAAGHLLRVVHNDTHIVFEYYRQVGRMRDHEGRRVDRDVITNEHVVSVTVPPSYVARMIGVLEGNAEPVRIQSRYTTATFQPHANQARTHSIHCEYSRPSAAMGGAVESAAAAPQLASWDVHLNVAESLMLHRFLSQSLRYNSGFGQLS